MDDARRDVFQLVCNSPSSAVDAYLATHVGSVDIANDKGDTPLIMAARRGDLAVVHSLIAAGADVHTRNIKGSNPLIAVSTTLNTTTAAGTQSTDLPYCDPLLTLSSVLPCALCCVAAVRLL